MTEAQVQAHAVALIAAAGADLPPYHTHDSRRSGKGFPDLVALVSGRTLWVECKTETGVLSAEQVAWLNALAERGEWTFICTPSSLPQLERMLGLGSAAMPAPTATGQQEAPRRTVPDETKARAQELGPRVARALQEQWGG